MCGSWCFEGMYYLHLQGSGTPRRIPMLAAVLGLPDLWRWKHHVPLKRREPLTQWHIVISQNTWSSSVLYYFRFLPLCEEYCCKCFCEKSARCFRCWNGHKHTHTQGADLISTPAESRLEMSSMLGGQRLFCSCFCSIYSLIILISWYLKSWMQFLITRSVLSCLCNTSHNNCLLA